MKTLTLAEQAALSGRVVYSVLLIYVGFGAGAVAFNSSNHDLVWDGVTYRGAYGLGRIGPITDRAGQVQGLEFELAATSTAGITLALDGADQWQGSPVILRQALVAADTFTVAGAQVEWSGRGDTFTVRESGGQSVVVATAESAHVDMLRGSPLTYSHADQQLVVPGDRFFEFVNAQSDKSVVWPSKEWFYK